MLKGTQLLALALGMFVAFIAWPLFQAHRHGEASFSATAVMLTGLVAYVGITSLFTDPFLHATARNAQGKERLTRKGWTLLLGAGVAVVLTVVLWEATLHRMGLNGPTDIPQRIPQLPDGSPP